MGLVTVAAYDWRMDAYLAQSRLESCGIETFVPDDCYSSIVWENAKAIGGIRLQVNEGDAEDGLAVLRDAGEGVGEPAATEVEQSTDRLMRSATFCIVMPAIFGPYGLWLLLGRLSGGTPLETAELRKVWTAALLIVGMVVFQLATSVAWLFR